jgi:hypothetical protein
VLLDGGSHWVFGFRVRRRERKRQFCRCGQMPFVTVDYVDRFMRRELVKRL